MFHVHESAYMHGLHIKFVVFVMKIVCRILQFSQDKEFTLDKWVSIGSLVLSTKSVQQNSNN